MILTRLNKANSQFPESKEPGDVVIMHNGEIFCYCNDIWILLGGRFLPKTLRETFIQYISTGWPDPSSAKFDIPTMFDLSKFQEYGDYDLVPTDPKFVKLFTDRVYDISEKLHKTK